ncbi:hypothetical protein AvCA_48260 [Azotobacter vinelandii CA]|uniref:DUF2269 family protein n=2 Tax=Azotobacter vinelandii TaxID=354 RepID=C1DK24_AZOVD|nr:DUF2269 family protein [Azotobacter vinelandii]ACO80929.1 Conserved hypothetical protein [Azotobacter vinelandii DJ]AGK15851.1 hypothetical protein AvCA_48260 [Azotobacter vinelandii CA]AGK22240.1 hypothetical protein AvCA6_48260 [Azotobacter vinelandii CA6]SFW99948.1 Predicted integral membrane protein [Azotobacter vinelandii]GLK60596.1 hypothetical protein GCM10017624_27580 [Azotobacter vinelandii]
MEHFALLKMLHGVAGVLLFVAFFALAGLCWRARPRPAGAAPAGAETEADAAGPEPAAPDAEGAIAEGAEAEAPARASPWPALCAVLLLLCLIALPVSGWWLAHLAGWPLGQIWLLGSSLLFLPGAVCGLWLAARVAGRRRKSLWFSLVLALLGLACFATTLWLMVAKPV